MNNLILLVLFGYCSADYCQDNFTLAEMPHGVFANVENFILKQTNISDCSEIPPVDANLINFWYWSRKNANTPILLDKNKPRQLDLTKPTKILVPGWLCNVTNDRMPELRKAYLQRYDCNVIGVDWSIYSIDVYGNTYCRVPQVAKVVAAFICRCKLDVRNVHIVGHSLGGQMSGLIGQEVTAQCSKKIQRITGLDPAGPLYQFQPPSNRLDPTDAVSVDVIHTNEGLFGYFGSCGTTDYFPNCGITQPGCVDFRTLSIADILNLPLNIANCNHIRSIDYMIESINSNNFKSRSSRLCPSLCLADKSYSTAVMGEGSAPINPSNQYILRTNSQSPYARG